tara:strand:+ start:2185 stop:2955 length:771 start_codon:yes stop_codon:yes gene_type:complete
MTIKQLGGVFGRNPTFNDVTIEGQLTFDGDIDVNSDLTVDGGLTVTGSTNFLGINNSFTSAGSANIYITGGDGNSKNIFFRKATGSTQQAKIQTIGDDLRFFTGSSEAARFNSSGNLAFPSGQGIDFSATAGTGTSELLDDYEEGTWTPNFAVNGFSGGATVSASSGTYTKVGRVVTVFWSVTLSTAAYMSSYSQIDNIPFASTVSGTSGSYATGSIGGNVIGSFGAISTSNLFLFQSISTSTSTSWDGSHTYIAS